MKKRFKFKACDSDAWIKCLSLVYTENLRQYKLILSSQFFIDTGEFIVLRGLTIRGKWKVSFQK